MPQLNILNSTMTVLKIPYAERVSANKLEMASLFDQLPYHMIDQVSWNTFPYKPEAFFKIAYTHEAILLHYEVKEKYLRINSFQSNDPVYEDSCVEFFISFKDGLYYNFEFNAIGVGLIGYGTSEKSSRERLSNSVIERVKSFSEIATNVEREGVNWKLSLYIPFEVFDRDHIESLKGIKATANFYKCGDLLPEPHFVSWKPIQAPEPNFHLPDFFGEIEFTE